MLGSSPKTYISDKDTDNILEQVNKTQRWAVTEAYTQEYFPVYEGDNAESKMSEIYNGLATDIMALAEGTVTDTIPAGFKLTDISKIDLQSKGVAVTENQDAVPHWYFQM